MRRVERLPSLAKTDFRFVFTQGRTIRLPLFHVLVLPNQRALTRLGVIVSRSHARSAVARNQIRRRTREWIRKNAPRLPISLDLVIRFNPVGVGAPRQTLYAELEKLFQRLGAR